MVIRVLSRQVVKIVPDSELLVISEYCHIFTNISPTHTFLQKFRACSKICVGKVSPNAKILFEFCAALNVALCQLDNQLVSHLGGTNEITQNYLFGFGRVGYEHLSS